jgi:hypothetical protein
MDNATNQDNRSSWWDYAAGASALLLITSGLIYVLGLFTLWAPIAMTKTDYLTAWHAASLVPKIVVAGLGVQQLVAFPLLTGTLTFTIVFYSSRVLGGAKGLLATIFSLYALVIGYCTWRIATGPGMVSQAPLGWLIPLVFALTIFIVSFIYFLFHLIEASYKFAIGSAIVSFVCVGITYVAWRGVIASTQAPQGKPSIDNVALIDIAIIAGAGSIMFWVTVVVVTTLVDSSRVPDTGFWSWLPPFRAVFAGSWRRLVPFLVVLFTAFVAAFMLSIPSRPPLPSVEIDIKGKDTEAVHGNLLTHTDAFWYVFQQQKSRVTAIPDHKVERVWVSEGTE